MNFDGNFRKFKRGLNTYAGFNLGEVQNIVDEGQERFAA